MGLTVGEECQQLLTGLLKVVGTDGLALLGTAYVALAAVMGAAVAEIFEELSRTAAVGRLGIVEHGTDALTVLLEAVVIDGWWQLDVFSIVTAL